MDRIDRKRVQILDALETLQRANSDEQLLAGQVMTGQPSCISADTCVLELVRMIHANAFRHLLVTDKDGQLLGVISDRDVLRCLGPGAADKEKLTRIVAGDLMSTDLVTITSQTPLVQAIGILIDQGISCLPIVDEGRLVGIMTNTDMHVVLQMLLRAVCLSGSEKPLSGATRLSAESR